MEGLAAAPVFFNPSPEWLDYLSDYLNDFVSALNRHLASPPDSVYVYLSIILFVAVVVELMVRGELPPSSKAQQQGADALLATAMEQPTAYEIAELRSEIDGVEEEDVLPVFEGDVSILSVGTFESEVRILPWPIQIRVSDRCFVPLNSKD